MKKILLATISIICIITYSVGLTGCGSIENKSDISENYSTRKIEINGTNIPEPSHVPATAMPTQSNASLSGDNNNTIDYNKFIKKVWIVENSINNYTDYYQSFHISKIADGEILGELSLIDPSLPNPDYHSPNDISYWANFTGTINKNVAECQFKFATGDTGKLKLIFESSKEIKAIFEYKNNSQDIKDEVQNLKDNSINLHLDGTYKFKPYNLNDLNKFTPLKDQSFIVDLNSWGKVRFVSGKLDSGKHILTVCFLTNIDRDILYDFGSSFPYDVDIKTISFKDVNKDKLKDLIIITDCEELRAYVYFQKPDGSFYDDGELDKEINDSGNNKNIKTVIGYLLKKF